MDITRQEVDFSEIIFIERGYKTDLIDLRVAGLGLRIDARGTDLILAPPPNYVKFLQPVAEPRAELKVRPPDYPPGFDKDLILYLRDELSPSTGLLNSALFRSDVWELWKDGEGNYIFRSTDQTPPCKVLVSPEFTHGEILWDFSRNFSRKVYPLQDLDIRVYSVWLASMGEILLHAAGVMMDERGFCFVGESRAGKSTLAAALSANPSVTVLGEDQVILRFLDNRFWIFGTPWHLDPTMCSPLGVPLEKMFFLDRSAVPGVAPVKPVDGVVRLLQTAFIPYYLPNLLPGILDRLALLAEHVPSYSLSYQLGVDAWQLISEA